MIPVTHLRGQARRGLRPRRAAGARPRAALVAGGARGRRLGRQATAREAAATLGGHCRPTISRMSTGASFAALVLSPGVPLTHPEPHWTVEHGAGGAASRSSATSSCSAASARRRAAAPFVAITGTNGKSTTTALIAPYPRGRGPRRRSSAAISARAILILEPPATGRIYVLEMSSFQIDLTPPLEPERRRPGSTSRPTISTATAPCAATPRSRRACSRTAPRTRPSSASTTD